MTEVHLRFVYDSDLAQGEVRTKIVPLPHCVKDGELELPHRDVVEALIEGVKPPVVEFRLSLVVSGKRDMVRVGSSISVFDFDDVLIEDCDALRVVDATAPCKWLTLRRCAALRTVRANVLSHLDLKHNPNLVCVDALGGPGSVSVDACDALAFMRGVDRTHHLTVYGRRYRRGAPLYIAGERFERCRYEPVISNRVVMASPLVPEDRWDTVNGVPHVSMWYKDARRRMDERTWLTLAWRALTGGGNDVTGLAHSDLLRRAIFFL